MKRYHIIIILTLLAVISTSACESGSTLAPVYTLPAAPTTAPASTATSTVTFTPDPCAPENITTEVEKVHKIMREFDDAALLASNTPIELLNPSIADLQRIRRSAEDQPIPACLNTLKQYQLAHMNTVINTMLGFLNNAETEVLNQGIALARQQHDQYTLELANLLGLTVVVAPTSNAAVATPTFAGLYITNPGPTTVNFRAQPDLTSGDLGIMAVGASATVLGRTADALWFQVEFPNQPGQTAWVYASLVQLSDPTADLPVLTPIP